MQLNKFIESCLNNNKLDELLENCSDSVKYIGIHKRIVYGKASVKKSLKAMMRKTSFEPISKIYYSAQVDYSLNKNIKCGDHIIAIAANNKIDCLGFLTYICNQQEKIEEIRLCTDSDVSFHCDDYEAKILMVPYNAGDSISLMAYHLKLADYGDKIHNDVQNDRTLQAIFCTYMYAVSREATSREDIWRMTANAAKYIFALAIVDTIKEKRNETIQLSMSIEDIAAGKKPFIGERYQKWIDEGYALAQELYRSVNAYFVYHDFKKTALISAYSAVYAYGAEKAYTEIHREDCPPEIEFAIKEGQKALHECKRYYKS